MSECFRGAKQALRSTMARAAVWLGVALILVIAAGCSEDDIERQLGSATAAAIERTYPVNRDPLLADWTEEIGQTLTAFSTRQQIPYSFKVIDTSMINAFAAPYGHIYVTQGLLDFAESEDEVIGVIGHEIGHVVHRHIIKSVKQQFLFSLGVQILAGESETLADIAALGLGLLMLRYSQLDEYEADDAGAALAYRAGYNPQGVVDFLDKLHREINRGRGGGFLEVLLSTHPFTPRRIDRQMEKTWVALTDPEANLRVAQGYLRRGQYQAALQRLEQVPEGQRDQPHYVLLLADAQQGRGNWEGAREQYQLASTAVSSDYPQLALASLAALVPPVVMPPTAAERQQAQALRQEAAQALSAVQASEPATQADWRSLQAGLEQGRQLSSGTLNLLSALATQRTQLTPELEQTVLRANNAVSQAADCVYSLEHFEVLTRQSMDWNRNTARQTAAYLEQVAQGAGQSGNLPLARSALYEIRTAAAELQQARAMANSALAPALQAQSLARDTARLVDGLWRTPAAERPALTRADQAAEATRQIASAALKQSKEAERLASKAKIRAMIATLQLAHAEAGPELLPGLDRMVAHYLRGTPGQVAALRDRDLGYGDIAVALAAGRSSRTSPSALAEQAGPGLSLLDRVEMSRDGVNGLKVMLRFLSLAMIEEVGLAPIEPEPAARGNEPTANPTSKYSG